MSASYLTTKDAADAAKQAEILGRAYAAKRGLPWPMPPDSYGPGRQPSPAAAYFQRWYVVPQPDPTLPPPARGNADTRPLLLLVDATVVSLDKASVTLTDGTKVAVDVSKAVTK
jgi:hypothetical protein